jgi:hypothetical protein
MLSMESKGVVVADVLKNPIEKFDCNQRTNHKSKSQQKPTLPTLLQEPVTSLLQED